MLVRGFAGMTVKQRIGVSRIMRVRTNSRWR